MPERKSGGALRLISPTAICDCGERSVDWKVQGRPGVGGYEIVRVGIEQPDR